MKIVLFFLLSASLGFAETPKVDVLIVGAGLSGLSTAYRLKKLGITFQILEMTSHIGGRIRTPNYQEGSVSMSAEGGLEEFWATNPTLEILNELKIPLEKYDGTFSSHYYKNKLYPFIYSTNEDFLKSVLTPEELKSLHEWDQSTHHIFEKLSAKDSDPALKKLKDISFSEWVKKSKLDERVQDLIRTHTEPEFATSWERISAAEGIAEWHIFSQGGVSSFHVAKGNQSAAEAIANSLPKDTVLLNTQASRIKDTADGVEVTTMNSGTFKEKVFKAKYVVTTMPLYRLFELHFDPPLEPKRVEAIQTQTWGSYFTAHLIFDAKAKSYLSVKGQSVLPILSGSELGVIYGANHTPGKKEDKVSLLNFLVTGDFAERFNSRLGSLDQVKSEMESALEKHWPGFKKFIIRWNFIRYHPRAIASWPIGRSRYDDLSELMRTPQGRIYFAGDFTEGTHSDGAAQSAIRVVKQISEREKK